MERASVQESEVPLEIIDFSCTNCFETVVDAVESFVYRLFTTREEFKELLYHDTEIEHTAACRSASVSSQSSPDYQSCCSDDKESNSRRHFTSGTVGHFIHNSPQAVHSIRNNTCVDRPAHRSIVITQDFPLCIDSAHDDSHHLRHTRSYANRTNDKSSSSAPHIRVEVHLHDRAHAIAHLFGTPFFFLVRSTQPDPSYRPSESAYYLSILVTAVGNVFGGRAGGLSSEDTRAQGRDTRERVGASSECSSTSRKTHASTSMAQGDLTLDVTHILQQYSNEPAVWRRGRNTMCAHKHNGKYDESNCYTDHCSSSSSSSGSTTAKEEEEDGEIIRGRGCGMLSSPFRLSGGCPPCFVPTGDVYAQSYEGSTPHYTDPLDVHLLHECYAHAVTSADVDEPRDHDDDEDLSERANNAAEADVVEDGNADLLAKHMQSVHVARCACAPRRCLTHVVRSLVLDLVQPVFVTRFSAAALPSSSNAAPTALKCSTYCSLASLIDTFQLQLGRRSRVCSGDFDGICVSVEQRYSLPVPWRFRPLPGATARCDTLKSSAAHHGNNAIPRTREKQRSRTDKKRVTRDNETDLARSPWPTFGQIVRRANAAMQRVCGNYTHPFGTLSTPLKKLLVRVNWRQLHDTEVYEMGSQSSLDPFATQGDPSERAPAVLRALRRSLCPRRRIAVTPVMHPRGQVRHGMRDTVYATYQTLLDHLDVILADTAKSGENSSKSYHYDDDSTRSSTYCNNGDLSTIESSNSSSSSNGRRTYGDGRAKDSGATDDDVLSPRFALLQRLADAIVAAECPVFECNTVALPSALFATYPPGSLLSRVAYVCVAQHHRVSESNDVLNHTSRTDHSSRNIEPESRESDAAHMRTLTEMILTLTTPLSGNEMCILWRCCGRALQRMCALQEIDAVSKACAALSMPERRGRIAEGGAVDLSQSLLIQNMQLLHFSLSSWVEWDAVDIYTEVTQDMCEKDGHSDAENEEERHGDDANERESINLNHPADAQYKHMHENGKGHASGGETERCPESSSAPMRLITHGELLIVPPPLPVVPCTTADLKRQAEAFQQLVQHTAADADRSNSPMDRTCTRYWTPQQMHELTLYNEMCLFLYVNHGSSPQGHTRNTHSRNRVVTFVDFVHWYSPRDFIAPSNLPPHQNGRLVRSPASDKAATADEQDAYLSARMQRGHRGGFQHAWQHLWHWAQPCSPRQLKRLALNTRARVSQLLRWWVSARTCSDVLIAAELLAAMSVNAAHRILSHPWMLGAHPSRTGSPAQGDCLRDARRDDSNTHTASAYKHCKKHSRGRGGVGRCYADAMVRAVQRSTSMLTQYQEDENNVTVFTRSEQPTLRTLYLGDVWHALCALDVCLCVSLTLASLLGEDVSEVDDAAAAAVKETNDSDMSFSSLSDSSASGSLCTEHETMTATLSALACGCSRSKDHTHDHCSIYREGEVVISDRDWECAWVPRFAELGAQAMAVKGVRVRMTCMAERPLGTVGCFQQMVMHANPSRSTVRVAVTLSEEVM